MKRMLHSSLSLLAMISILISISPIISYAADTEADLEIVRSRAVQLQATNPSLPWWVPEQKWTVWTLLAALFDADGKIGNVFLKLLGARTNNQIMKWDATSGQLVGSQITDNGTNVGIWNTNPLYKLDVDGDISFTWDLRQNGIPFSAWGWKFIDGTPTATEAVYMDGNVGIGTINPTQKLDVVWNGLFSGTVTASSFSGNGAAITAISGDNITDNTIDSSEIQDDTLTASDLAANSVWNSELIDAPTFTTVIATANPTASNHLTTKSYVDSAVSWAGDNLWNHTATADLNMWTRAISSSAGTIRDGWGWWVRTYGATGWYNGTYTWGWYMNDATWIRAFNNKNIVTWWDMQAAAFTYSSDKNLKKNIKPLGNTDDVLNTWTYRFYWKSDNSSDIGFIAQEIEEIYPEFVKTNGQWYKSVDYAKMVVPLLEITRQQQEQIDALESMIIQLKNQ